MKKILFLILFYTIHTTPLLSENFRVIDGDTIILNNKKIRFSGIDTPELKQTCINNNKKIFCGVLVKTFLINKIGNKIPICIEQGKDIYKRTLAECFIDNKSLSSFLVKNGYAFAYRKYSKKFIKDEEHAKVNKLGLWQMEFQYPWDYRKKSKN
tara:strand:+ start:24 stop:485 length:462 start_codon:yes stop_codon:yes gene_type:complete